MKIIIVDDEYLICEGLKKIIRSKYPEIEVSSFTDPVTVLDKISEPFPDLLITDIKMPGMSGLELIEKAKEKGLKHYAVLTGLSDIPLIQKSIRLQVTDYLIKPVNKQELFNLISNISEKQKECRKNVAEELAERFCAAMDEDISIMSELTRMMQRCDYPALVLDTFIRKAQRKLPFYETCRLAGRLLNCTVAELDDIGKEIRGIRVRPGKPAGEVATILKKIEEEYDRELSVVALAKELFLQPNYLSTVFKKETGYGFVWYLNRERISEACRKMYTSPDVPINSLALECGFPSSRYFFTTFKKYTGVTPGVFREELELLYGSSMRKN